MRVRHRSEAPVWRPERKNETERKKGEGRERSVISKQKEKEKEIEKGATLKESYIRICDW